MKATDPSGTTANTPVADKLYALRDSSTEIRDATLWRTLTAILIATALVHVLPACHRAERPTPTSDKGVASDIVLIANGPGGPQIFRWDFSKERTWSYAYSQRMTNQHEMDGRRGNNEANAKGIMDVVSKGGGTANLVLRDIQVTTNSRNGTTGSTQHALPTQVIPGVTEDGSTGEDVDARAALLKLLVPLPRHALKIGEFDNVPLSIPVNANGSSLSLRGVAKVTLTGFARVHDRTSGVLDVVFDVSTLEVPPEISGTYQASLKGKSTLYFDAADRTLVSGRVAVVLSMKSNIPAGAVKDTPIATAMTMDTVITLDRRVP